PGEAIALNNLASIEEDDGDIATARDHYQDAIAIASEVGNLELEIYSLGNLGNLDENQGRFEDALESYERAIDLYEGIRAAVSIEEFRTSLAELSGALYEHAARLRLRLGQPESAFDLSERARARTLLGQLGRGQIDVRQGADAELVEIEQTLRLELGALQRSLQEEGSKRTALRNQEVLSSLNAELATKRSVYTDVLTRLKLAN